MDHEVNDGKIYAPNNFFLVALPLAAIQPVWKTLCQIVVCPNKMVPVKHYFIIKVEDLRLVEESLVQCPNMFIFGKNLSAKRYFYLFYHTDLHT